MAVFRCKMCGGDIEAEEGASSCTCEFCGTRQTVPKVKMKKYSSFLIVQIRFV